jgi:Ca2+-binding RTX toxin-like protein
MHGEDGNDMMLGGQGNDELYGGGGRDTLIGGAGDDILNGGRSYDKLTGGAGDDILFGDFGRDTFIFVGRDGDDVILDFTNGQDWIDISAFGITAAEYATVVAPAMFTNGDSVYLDLGTLGGYGSVIIQGVTLSDMDASDFIF